MSGYTKEQQLQDNREKRKRPKKKKRIEKPWSKVVIDVEYLRWLRLQPSVISGKKAKPGAGAYSMSVHHINGRGGGKRNDHEAVPLIGYEHSWGPTSYHSMADSDYREKYLPFWHGTVKEYFLEKARQLRQQYKKEKYNQDALRYE